MKPNPMATAALMAAAILGLGITGYGQNITYTPGYAGAPPVPVYQTAAPAPLTAQQLDQLLGPIALYPDPLLSIVLAASTYPQDVTAAAQWLQSFPNPSEDDINAQPWDPSVKALVHYPTVVQMLASQPDWMASLGAAFATQQQDVMASVQRLRAQAEAANTLVSTPQQQVVNDNGYIEVLPVQPNVIYVPYYDPDTIYVGNPGYTQPWITFSAGYGIGGWLDFGWDWRNHRFDRGVQWGRDWRRPVFNHGQPWQHNPGRPIPRPPFPTQRPHGIGGNVPGRPSGAFDPHLAPRPAPRPGVRAPERPVIGINNHHENVPPARAPEVHPVPRATAPPAYHPIERPAPAPRGPVERPVQGIPREAPRAAPPAPVERPAPAPRAAPSPVFGGGGGGAAIQSSRGHASMRH